MPRIPFWPDKDPNETVAYAVDWSDRLGADTISSSTFSVVAGTVSISNSANTTTTATLALSGGVTGEDCEILNRIVTASGETLDQTCLIRIRKR